MPGRSPTILTSRLRHDDVTTEAHTLDSGSLFNVNEFLNQKNVEFVIASGSTIAFLVTLMLAGLVGNTLVFIVYYKRFKPSVTRTYILAMSVCDFIINILVIPLQLVEIRYSATFDSEWGCKMSRSTSIFLVLFSAALLVAVSIDRQTVICSLRHSLQFSLKAAYISILLCGVASFVLSVPYAVITGKSKRSFVDSNITGGQCSVSDEYTGSASVIVFDVTIVFAYVLCVVIMSVLYGRIVRHLWHHKKTTATITARGTPRRADWWVYFKKNRSDTRDKDGLTLEINVDYADGATVSCHVEEPSSARLLSQEAKHNDKAANEEQAIPISETDITTSFSQPEQSLNQQLTVKTTEVRGQVKDIPSRTTVMLFVLTVVFVLNYLPYLIIKIQEQASSKESLRSVEPNWRMIGLRSFYVNSAVNPLVYSFCSVRFRFECRHLLCGI
ncbi:orexin receptor type 2-like [Littorina saxatilis]|uniref:orexin receptor type 2-like n=1 Tax=Littorina saxatilis TaxID=31220 RepID=UPI0038B59B5F